MAPSQPPRHKTASFTTQGYNIQNRDGVCNAPTIAVIYKVSSFSV